MTRNFEDTKIKSRLRHDLTLLLASVALACSATLACSSEDPASGGDAVAGAGGLGAGGNGTANGSGEAGGMATSGGSAGTSPTEDGVCAQSQFSPQEGEAFIHFDEGRLQNSLGTWYTYGATDKFTPVHQTGKWDEGEGIVTGGADGTPHSLRISGSGLAPHPEAEVFETANVGVFWDRCVDFSSVGALSFWAKGDLPRLTVELILPSTQSVELGGDCTQDCPPHPIATAELSDAWQQYVLRFDQDFENATPLQESGKIRSVVWSVRDAPDGFGLSIDQIGAP